MTSDPIAVARRYFEAYSRGDLETAKDLMAPDHRFHFPLSPEPLDREAHSGAQHACKAAIPDFHFEIDAQYRSGDIVVTRGRFGGTHEGDFFGNPATGNQVSVPFTNVMRIVNGKNAEEWDAFDTLGLMQQVGAIPVT